MDFYIVIPCHNEAAYVQQTLQSLVEQTLTPKKIVVVDDNSTDKSAEIVSAFAKAYSYISIKRLNDSKKNEHLPGSKVIRTFYEGLNTLDTNYDVICKFDADLIFPQNYLERLAYHFENNDAIGMAGGFCYIKKGEDWILENLTNKDHLRGALKAYRKKCFEDIGGLKIAMGWDTIDELLAQYHNWEVRTDATLKVKHLKPTGVTYDNAAQFKQGEAFYKMRYGFLLTSIASLKLANRKGSLLLFKNYLRGYLKAKKSKTKFLVSKTEGRYIRAIRWKGIRKKLGF